MTVKALLLLIAIELAVIIFGLYKAGVYAREEVEKIEAGGVPISLRGGLSSLLSGSR